MLRLTSSILAMFVFCLPALGGISAPNSSVTPSRDGSRVLVMLSPYPTDDNRPTATLPDGHLINVHTTFPKSGVYDVPTLQPVWQVNWFELSRDLLCSDDLRYVVRLNRFAFPAGTAISFYDQGNPGPTYNCRSLLRHLAYRDCLPFQTMDWHRAWYGKTHLDADGKTLHLSTARREIYILEHEIDLGYQESYTFDLTTGAMLSSGSTGLWRPWTYAAAPPILLLLLCLLTAQLIRRIRTRRSRRARGFPVIPK